MITFLVSGNRFLSVAEIIIKHSVVHSQINNKLMRQRAFIDVKSTRDVGI